MQTGGPQSGHGLLPEPCQRSDSPQTAEALLDGLNGWKFGIDHRDTHQPNILYKTFRYPTFAEAMKVAQQVANVSTGEDDHLGLSIYGIGERGKLTVTLATFQEEGPPFGVTEQDINLSRKIEADLSKAT